MSYGRNPHYIYSNGNELYLDGVYVNEEVVNAFLYSVLLSHRREELKRRLQEGKQIWLKPHKLEGDLFIELPESHPEVLMEKEWQEMQEDEIMKKLIGS